MAAPSFSYQIGECNSMPQGFFCMLYLTAVMPLNDLEVTLLRSEIWSFITSQGSITENIEIWYQLC